MIENAHKIAEDNPAIRAKFQEQILEHWQQIQQNRRYPLKRDFRPQMFPRYLPQLAIVEVEDSEHFTDRLTGTTVSEVLRLSAGRERLVAPSDENISNVVRSMLGKTSEEEQPMYFEGTFEPEESTAFDFTALVLPFSVDDPEDEMETLLLAFDFSRGQSLGALS
jgi:hypothetical protein